ncbi:hypothetical protein K439DRAFT_1060684 [Ramaria rubella]|nr:hypothetical protein K439DRAFT_1060684 [Ramaria rubella]
MCPPRDIVICTARDKSVSVYNVVLYYLIINLCFNTFGLMAIWAIFQPVYYLRDGGRSPPPTCLKSLPTREVAANTSSLVTFWFLFTTVYNKVLNLIAQVIHRFLAALFRSSNHHRYALGGSICWPNKD